MVETSASPSGPASLKRHRAFLLLLRHFLSDLAVLAPEKQQWFALADHNVLHFRNKDGMVARFLRRLQPAFEVRQRPMQHRSSLRRAVKPRPSLFFRVLVNVNRPRIVFRNHSLVLSQNVNPEALL